MRKDKKKIEELEEALSNAVYKISSLKIINRDNKDTIKQLRADIAGKDEKYTELLERYISMMEVKVNSHCVYEKKIKDVKIIVREHEMRPDFTEDSNSLVMKEMSTVAVKLRYGGIEYGDYIVLNKPSLEVNDVVDVANELFVSLLSALDQPQEGDGNE